VFVNKQKMDQKYQNTKLLTNGKLMKSKNTSPLKCTLPPNLKTWLRACHFHRLILVLLHVCAFFTELLQFQTSSLHKLFLSFIANLHRKATD